MSKDLETYQKVAMSLVLGIARAFQTRIVANTIQILLVSYKVTALQKLDLPEHLHDLLSHLGKLSDEEFSGFAYVVDTSLLVYVTTVFDTFLSETTKFLFLRNPGSVGKDISIPFDDLLSGKSRPDFIVDVVEKKVRETSYLSFASRIKFLRDRFGLQLDLADEALDKIEHYGSARNTIVHDQAIFHQTLDANGQIMLESERCPIHPTPVTREEYSDATVAFLTTALAIYEAVATQVLKAKDRGEFRETVNKMIWAVRPS